MVEEIILTAVYLLPPRCTARGRNRKFELGKIPEQAADDRRLAGARRSREDDYFTGCGGLRHNVYAVCAVKRKIDPGSRCAVQFIEESGRRDCFLQE